MQDFEREIKKVKSRILYLGIAFLIGILSLIFCVYAKIMGSAVAIFACGAFFYGGVQFFRSIWRYYKIKDNPYSYLDEQLMDNEVRYEKKEFGWKRK